MHITSETSAGRILLKISGRFDMDAQHLFRAAYRKALAGTPHKHLVVDLAGVDYVDSSALGLLLLLRQDAEAGGVDVGISGCNSFVRDILRMAHFDRLFAMHDQAH